MSAACENLEVAKTQLYVAGQVVSSASNNTTAHLGLGKAARDVMQAVLRVSMNNNGITNVGTCELYADFKLCGLWY